MPRKNNSKQSKYKSMPKKKALAKKSQAKDKSKSTSSSSRMTEELQWQSERDAMTLADAEEIKADRARLRRAKSEAKKRIARMEKVTKAGK